MRFFLLAGFGALLVITAGQGCGSFEGVTPDGGLGDASPDGAAVDAAKEAASTDGSADASDGGDGGDGGDSGEGVVCQLTGGTYDRTCVVPADCGMVARGCHCGAQPVIGVSKSVLAAAQACETAAANDCALGCAMMPGQVADDGKKDDVGTIKVVCESSMCRTIVE